MWGKISQGNNLDAFARALGSTQRRRTFVGSGLGSVLAWLAAADGEAGRNKARKKKRRRRRRRNNEKACQDGTKACGKQCIPTAECCGGCGGGEECCNGLCTDLATDGANCNRCGHTCLSGECIHGACQCGSSLDCPDGCGCTTREDDGERACVAPDFTGPSCNSDRDCPRGSFCIQTALVCAAPCLS